MTVDDLTVSGVPRYPVGISPIIDPSTGEVPIDSIGRRSYTTGMSYCPSFIEGQSDIPVVYDLLPSLSIGTSPVLGSMIGEIPTGYLGTPDTV